MTTTSPARLAANRRNALRSTGPRTPSGKARSARNATVHGLDADRPALNGPERARLSRRLRAWSAALGPADDAEEALVRRAALASIVLERLDRLDALAWAGAAPGQAPDGRTLAALVRQSGRWERALHAALRRLRRRAPGPPPSRGHHARPRVSRPRIPQRTQARDGRTSRDPTRYARDAAQSRARKPTHPACGTGPAPHDPEHGKSRRSGTSPGA